MEERVSLAERVMHEARMGGLCDECPAVIEALREAEEIDGSPIIIPGVNSLQFSPDLLALVFLSLQVNRAARELFVLERIKGLGSLASHEACPGTYGPSESELSRELARRFEAIIGQPPELPANRCGLIVRHYKGIAKILKEGFDT